MTCTGSVWTGSAALLPSSWSSTALPVRKPIWNGEASVVERNSPSSTALSPSSVPPLVTIFTWPSLPAACSDFSTPNAMSSLETST